LELEYHRRFLQYFNATNEDKVLGIILITLTYVTYTVVFCRQNRVQSNDTFTVLFLVRFTFTINKAKTQ